MFYAKYQHSAVKYENACTILQTRPKSHTISNKVETAWLFEKHGGECGIRTHVPLRTTRFRVERGMTTSIRPRDLITIPYPLEYRKMLSRNFQGIFSAYVRAWVLPALNPETSFDSKAEGGTRCSGRMQGENDIKLFFSSNIIYKGFTLPLLDE